MSGRKGPAARWPAGSERGERLLVLAGSAFVLLACAYRLGAPSLHVDEGASYVLTTAPLAEFWRLLAGNEVSGAPYYLLLRLWASGSTSEWFLRMPSLLAAVAAVPTFWLVARRLADALTVKIGVVLLVTNTLLLTWGREIRGYALVLLLMTASAYAFINVLRRPAPRWGYAWVVLSALAIYTHVFAAFVVASQALVFLLFIRERARLLEGAKYLGLVGLLSVPMVALLALNYPPPAAFHYRPLSPWTFGFFGQEFTGAPRRLLVAVPAVIVMIGAIRALQTIRRQRGSWEAQASALVLLWAVVPVVAVVLISLKTPALHGRYLIMVLPAYVLLLATGLTWLRKQRIAAWLGAALVVAVGVPGIGALYDRRGSHDWRAVVAEIERGWEPGDALDVHATDHPALGYYLERSSLAGQAPITVYGYPDQRRIYLARSLDVIDFRDKGEHPVVERRVWHVARFFHSDFAPTNAGGDVVELASVDGFWVVRAKRKFPHSPFKIGLVAGFDVSLLERYDGTRAAAGAQDGGT